MMLFGSRVALDVEHHVEAAAELVGHQVDLALAARAVAGADRAVVRQRHGSDVSLGLDPHLPGPVVELLLPDAHVDLGEVVDAGVALGVGEHAPVVEDVGTTAQVRDDLVPGLRHRREVGVVDRRVLAVPAHRHHLTGLGATVHRCGVAVVPRSPVALGDLVAEVAGAVLLRDPEQPLAGGPDLVLVAVHHRAHQRPHVAGLGDVGLVVAAEVGDLPLVEEHRPGEGRDPGAGQRTDAGVGVVVVVERPERRELRLRLGEELEGGLGGDAERALVAHEQVLELVAARGLADLVPDAVADVHHLAGGQHVVEAEHQVAGVPVARTDQRPAARADASADQRARVRRRVVGVEQPVAGELLVELEHVDAGADGDSAVLEVELLDRVHPLDVDDDATAQGYGAVGEAGAAVAGYDGHPQVVGDPDDAGDLLGAGRQHREVGQPLGPAVHRERCRDTRPVVAVRLGGEDLLVAQHGAQCGDDLVETLDRDGHDRYHAVRTPSRRRASRRPDPEGLGQQLVDVDDVDVRCLARLAERPLGPGARAHQGVHLERGRLLEPAGRDRGGELGLLDREPATAAGAVRPLRHPVDVGEVQPGIERRISRGSFQMPLRLLSRQGSW